MTEPVPASTVDRHRGVHVFVLSGMKSKVVRGGVGALAWAATLAGATGVALHFSRWSSQLVVLAASGAPYLMGSALVGLLPHRYLSPGRTAAGTGIWSAYPLSDTVEYDGFVLNQLSATATVPGVGPVTLYALHPVPPVYSAAVWADELSRLREILDRSPADRPVIAGGDFNATHDHAQFRAMVSGRFGAAAEQAGAGRLVTYPTDKRWPPLVGIDHILVAGGRAVSVETTDLPGADHRALVARILLDRGEH